MLPLFASEHCFTTQRTQLNIAFAVNDMHLIIFGRNKSVTVVALHFSFVHVCDPFAGQQRLTLVLKCLESNCLVIAGDSHLYCALLHSPKLDDQELSKLLDLEITRNFANFLSRASTQCPRLISFAITSFAVCWRCWLRGNNNNDNIFLKIKNVLYSTPIIKLKTNSTNLYHWIMQCESFDWLSHHGI